MFVGMLVSLSLCALGFRSVRLISRKDTVMCRDKSAPFRVSAKLGWKTDRDW